MKNNFPLISCKCTTYGRTHLLEEALQSFLLQEWEGESELIIVNDYPLQKLIYNHPRIHIYNLDKTFSSIGEKENFAIERCSGDLIAVWDDDDIAMSNHLSNIQKYWKEDTNILHWGNGVYYNEPEITALTGLGNSGIVYSKKAWEAIGKSPLENAGGDMTLVERLHKLGNVVHAFPPNNEVSWWYMWGGRGYHQSGEGTDVVGRLNIIQRHSMYIEGERAKGKIPTGDIILHPCWKHNYKQMLEKYVNRK